MLNHKIENPEKIYIEITNRCNLSCNLCFRYGQLKTYYNSDISKQLFNKIISEAYEYDVKSIMFGGWGEPLIHKNIIEFIKTTKKHDFTLEINTNGVLIEKNFREIVDYNVDKLIISIDAASSEIYSRVRGYYFSSIIRGLKEIDKYKRNKNAKKPEIWFSYTLSTDNVDDATNVVKLASNLNVRGIIFSNLIPISEEIQNKCLYSNEKLSVKNNNLKIELARLSLFHQVSVKLPFFELKTERVCPFIERKATCITHDGRVTPCYNFLHDYQCYIYGRKKNIKQISYGNIGKQSLSSIWNDPNYVKFRQLVKFFQFPSCTDCDFHYDCTFSDSNEYDCWGNSPTCADCLYSRKIIICP